MLPSTKKKEAARLALWLGLLAASVLTLALDRRSDSDSEAPPPNPRAVVEAGRIARNDSLYVALLRHGVEREELQRMMGALRPVFDPRKVRPRDSYEIRRWSDGTIREVVLRTQDLSLYFLRRLSDGGYRAEVRRLPLEETVLGASGAIQVSLWESMLAQRIPPEVIVRFADIFAWQVDFLTEPRPGDEYRLVWKRLAGEGVREEGEILYARYRGKVAADKTAILFKGHYYDLEGASLRKQFLRAPLNYRRISSGFSRRRYHPILRYYRPHHGIDYAAAYGTPVVAVGNGTVTSVGWKGGTGKTLEIRHNAAYDSLYGHLSRYARGMRPGRKVREGEVVGYVGSSGLSTGPHLHFGFSHHGRPVNFFGMRLPPGRRITDTAELLEFDLAKRDGLDWLARVFGPGEPPRVVDLPGVLVAGGASK